MKILFLLLFLTGLSYGQTGQTIKYSNGKPAQGDVAVSVTYQKDSVLPNGVHQRTISGSIKRALFYDEKGIRVSKDKFYNSIDHKINIQGFTEADTIVSYKLYTRRNYAKISAGNSKVIRNYLAEITTRAVDSSKIIMIHFYSGVLGERSELSSSFWKTGEKRFIKKLPKDIDVQQYFVYKYDFDADDKGAKKNGWAYDKSGLIENTFLPTHFNYGSFIIIMPDGQCFTYFGEYEKERVSEGLQALLEKDKQ